MDGVVFVIAFKKQLLKCCDLLWGQGGRAGFNQDGFNTSGLILAGVCGDTCVTEPPENGFLRLEMSCSIVLDMKAFATSPRIHVPNNHAVLQRQTQSERR